MCKRPNSTQSLGSSLVVDSKKALNRSVTSRDKHSWLTGFYSDAYNLWVPTRKSLDSISLVESPMEGPGRSGKSYRAPQQGMAL